MGWTTDHATEQRLTALEHACRGAVGDRLRSVAMDSPEWTGTVYSRYDLPPEADAAVREAAVADEEVYTDGGRAVTSFEEGYVVRLQHRDTQVVVTSDGIKMDRESELSAAVRGVLAHEA